MKRIKREEDIYLNYEEKDFLKSLVVPTSNRDKQWCNILRTARTPKQLPTRSFLRKIHNCEWNQYINLLQTTQFINFVFSKKYYNKENRGRDLTELTVWSSVSSVIDNATDIALCKQKDVSAAFTTKNELKCKKSKKNVCELQIVRPSLHLEGCGLKAVSELDLFIWEIVKDLRRSNNIKKKKNTKKDGYLVQCQTAIKKGKTSKGFLEYEHRTGFGAGLSVVVLRGETSYGVHSVEVKLEDGFQYCFLLNRQKRAIIKCNNIVCFVDYLKGYRVSSLFVFVQPHKVMEL